MDGPEFNPLRLGADELSSSNQPIVGQFDDGTLDPSRLANLATMANDHGLAGAPYSFGRSTSEGFNLGFDGRWAKELSRLRAALFDAARVRNDVTGAYYPGFQEWALVSDPYLRNINSQAVSDGRLLLQQRGELKSLRDPEYIFPERKVPDLATRVSARMELEIAERCPVPQFGAANPWATFTLKSNGESVLLRGAGMPPAQVDPTIGSPPGNFGPADILFTWEFAGSSIGTRVLTGRTDLFEITNTFVRTPSSFNPRAFVAVYVRVKALMPTGAEIDEDELFQLDCVTTGALSAMLSRQRVCRLLVGDEREESFEQARVISASELSWKRISLNTDRLGIDYPDASGSARLDVALQLGGYIQGNVVARVTQGIQPFVPTVRARGGYWRARSAPIGTVSTAVLLGALEAYKYARNDGKTWSNAGHASSVAIGGVAEVRCANGPMASKQFADAGRIAIADEKTWGNFDAIDVEVPAVLQGPGAFVLPGVYLDGSASGGTGVNCRYYKIPLLRDGVPVTREQASFSQWNTNKAALDPDVKTFAQANAAGLRVDGTLDGPVYFHDARLTDRSGDVFWYRDLFTSNVDIVHSGQHFSHWLIQPDPDGSMHLFLLIDEKSLAIGFELGDLGPQLVYGPVQFWPAGKVTGEMFRAAWGESRGIDPGGNGYRVWGNNWTEFNWPLRYFDSAPVSQPIASWTVDREMGGRWQPGMKLRVHVPRRVSRCQAVDFQELTAAGVDLRGPNYSYLGLYSTATKGSEVYDLEVIRTPHRRELLIFRNGVAKVSHWPAVDLRLHRVVQVDRDGWLPEYPEAEIANWRSMTFGRDQEVYPDDYDVSSDGTITLSVRDDADEFTILMATYQARGECPDGLSIEVGVADPGANFHEWGVMGIDAVSQRVLFPFANDNGTVDQRWIIDQDWPVVYRRILGAVAATLETEAHTYSVAATDGQDHDVEGILAWVTVPEDAIVRYTCTWRGVRYVAGGAVREVFERTFTTEHPFGNGRHLVPPRIYATFADDDDLDAGELASMRLAAVAIVSARRNFGVRVKVWEGASGPAADAQLSGMPLRAHFNETQRMLKAWIAEG